MKDSYVILRQDNCLLLIPKQISVRLDILSSNSNCFAEESLTVAFSPIKNVWRV